MSEAQDFKKSVNCLPSQKPMDRQILEQYLWMYFSYHQDYWHTWIPTAKFAYNNSDHSSTKQSLFLTVYGKEPEFDSVHITQDTPAGKVSAEIKSVKQ
ncbi:hypothetical protein O181_012932 [Austropuccinia psidii MF-1]|uniref:Uncharacterized protein n=1 Tax=Austropuccinia psidii MF-1 TaxID=1389203 RepID=A0A9Q3GNG7_9BASI|nr:hypothetical protein [Austropuccinia psidii MF-1]